MASIKNSTTVKSDAPAKADFGILEQLRGLAAFYVVINHARGNLFAGGTKLSELKPISDWSFAEKAYMAALKLTSLGHEFVILFFLVSGYSIAYSLKHTKSLRLFYHKRLVRIYPPYLLGIAWALLVFFLIRIFMPGWQDCNNPAVVAQRLCRSADFANLSTILSNVFYLPKGFYIVQYWSLTQEIIFYLLIPLLLVRENWYLIGSITLYITSILLTGVANPSSLNHLYEFIIHYNFFFAIGIFLSRYPRLFYYPLLKHKWMYLLSLAFLFMLMIFTKGIWGDYNKVTEMVAAIFSLILINAGHRFQIKSGLLQWLGAQSYTMYVTHFASIILFQLVLHIAIGYDGGYIYSRHIWLLGVAFAVLCSWGLYLICERPTYNYLNRLRKVAIPAPVLPDIQEISPVVASPDKVMSIDKKDLR